MCGSHDVMCHVRLHVLGCIGAKPQLLAGKRVALTGIFPEVGGGSGLSFGKDRVKAIVAAFGGRVSDSCLSCTVYCCSSFYTSTRPLD